MTASGILLGALSCLFANVVVAADVWRPVGSRSATMPTPSSYRPQPVPVSYGQRQARSSDQRPAAARPKFARQYGWRPVLDSRVAGRRSVAPTPRPLSASAGQRWRPVQQRRPAPPLSLEGMPHPFATSAPVPRPRRPMYRPWPTVMPMAWQPPAMPWYPPPAWPTPDPRDNFWAPRAPAGRDRPVGETEPHRLAATGAGSFPAPPADPAWSLYHPVEDALR